MKEVKKKDIEYKIEELQAEIEKLKWEPEKITEEIEKLKWEPVKLKEWIEESSYPIDKNNIEGFIFDKLKEELIDKNKLNYNYGKEE
jgi:regulator of replication initiation timing